MSTIKLTLLTKIDVKNRNNEGKMAFNRVFGLFVEKIVHFKINVYNLAP